MEIQFMGNMDIQEEMVVILFKLNLDMLRRQVRKIIDLLLVHFPPEFFVEDFTFKVSNDDSVLDENNGRFCVTPEYPNGTYVYFATFDSASASDGIFKNFKKPNSHI